jgi:hypothetical protein
MYGSFERVRKVANEVLSDNFMRWFDSILMSVHLYIESRKEPSK